MLFNFECKILRVRRHTDIGIAALTFNVAFDGGRQCLEFYILSDGSFALINRSSVFDKRFCDRIIGIAKNGSFWQGECYLHGYIRVAFIDSAIYVIAIHEFEVEYNIESSPVEFFNMSIDSQRIIGSGGNVRGWKHTLLAKYLD